VLALVNYRKLFLEAFLICLGDVPLPGASIKELEHAAKLALIRLGAKSGVYVWDAEVPDSMLSVLIPALMTRGVQPQELAEVATAIETLGGSGGSQGPGGTIATTAATVENESLLNNISDMAGSALALNPGGFLGGAVDLVNDIFSGGGLGLFGF
jgi:hypothetical protein